MIRVSLQVTGEPVINAGLFHFRDLVLGRFRDHVGVFWKADRRISEKLGNAALEGYRRLSAQRG